MITENITLEWWLTTLRHREGRKVTTSSLAGEIFGWIILTLLQLHGDGRVRLQDHRHLAQPRLGPRPQTGLVRLALCLRGLRLVLAGLGEEFQEVGLTEAVVGGGEAAVLLVVDGSRHLLTVRLAGAEAVVLADDLQVVFLVLATHQIVLHLV